MLQPPAAVNAVLQAFRTREPRTRDVLIRWVAGVLVCMLAGTVALHFLGVRGSGAPTRAYARWPFVDMWMRWDALWYQGIARDGYSLVRNWRGDTNVAFFPFFALVIRAIAVVTRLDPYLAGWIAAMLSGLAACVLFARWCRVAPGALTTLNPGLWVLMAWPFAYYLYGGIYSDALFLALVLAAFLSLERGSAVGAAFFGALATATRPLGPAVVLGLFVRRVEWRRQRGESVRVSDFVPLLSGLGLVAYMAFLRARFGDALAFMHAQESWGQAPGWRTWLKVDLVMHPLSWVMPYVHILCVGLLVAVLFRMPKRLGWGYTAYAVVVLGMSILSSKSFVNTARYGLAAFPCFALLGEALWARPRARTLWFAAASVGLVVFVGKFAMGRFVA